LLPGEWNSSIDSLKDIEFGPFRNFRVDDVKLKIAILDAILELWRQLAKVLAMQAFLRRQPKSKVIPEKRLEGG
jgi:hypothetical protein